MRIGNVDFNVIQILGEGSFGKVFLVEKEGETYALKIIENGDNEGIKSLHEIDIMTRITHPNLMAAKLIITELIKIQEDNISKVGILMERAERDLQRAMYDDKLILTERINILYRIVLGVKTLHDFGYLHLDLKPLNVLLFKNGVKITDFGLSLLTEYSSENVRIKKYPIELQTITHRAPEVIDHFLKHDKEDFTYSAVQDVWSLGIIFLEVLSQGKSLYDNFTSQDYNDVKVKQVYEEYLGKNIDKTLKSFLRINEDGYYLIKRMLDFNPQNRITINEILTSKFFSKYQVVELSFGNSLMSRNSFIHKPLCDLTCYKGFDILFRMSIHIPIHLETFFLAADIYQRSLAYRNIEDTGKKEDEINNYRNISYHACLSLYIAIKMIESYFADIFILTDLVTKMFDQTYDKGRLFTPQKLLLGESFLVNVFEGMMYPNNLFTASTTERRLLQSFELLRNCFLYRYIDLQKWRTESEHEEIKESKFNKYISFSDFVGKTRYYHEYIKRENYIQIFFDTDERK